jgi:hypothetical protein
MKYFLTVICPSCGLIRNVIAGRPKIDRNRVCRKCATKNIWKDENFKKKHLEKLSKTHFNHTGREYPERRKGKDAVASKQLYNCYKQSAKRRGHVFELKYEDFLRLTKDNCYYCGSEPSKLHPCQEKFNEPYLYNGIDRVNNFKGYFIDNVVTCCTDCNNFKHAKSQEQFFDWIKKLTKNYIEKHSQIQIQKLLSIKDKHIKNLTHNGESKNSEGGASENN